MRDCNRYAMTICDEVQFVNRGFFTSSGRRVLGGDLTPVLGKTQALIRAEKIAELNRLNNFYFHTNEPPFRPHVVLFNL